MELTHEHVKRAYSHLGFDECGRLLTELERHDVLALAYKLSQKKRSYR